MGVSDAVELWFEDFAPGMRFELGSRAVGRDELIAFAVLFDPQRFHVDEQAARETHFGGLVASGWHTAAIFQRLHVDALLSRASCVGSPGLDEVRFLRPVRPGDVLTAELEVLRAEPSRTKPHRGTVTTRGSVRNQDDETVMTMTARAMFLRRPAGDGDAVAA